MAEHHAITTGTSWIDETILRMKEAGYSTKEIAEYLRKESNGEVDYDPKTIGTRYTRINKLLEEQAEQRIDDELTDWHEGEDEELLEVEAQVRVEIRQEMAKLKAKRWELVAHKLQSKLKKGIAYSAGSCQKRYVALQNDTATIPIELDDNPEQRLIQRQQKSIRLVEQIHKAEFAKEEAKNKKKLEKDQRELAYKQRKEEHSRKRHEKAVLESKKAADRLAKLEAQKAVTEKRQREEAERIAELQNNLATGISTRPDPLTPGQKRKANALNGGPSTESAFAKSTALPRGKMTLAELSALCQIRKVSKTGSKVQLQQRLQKEAEKATRAELRSRLSLYAADTEGTKEELVDRLAQADEANSDWAQNNGSSKRPRKRARTSNLSKPIVESSSDDVTVLAVSSAPAINTSQPVTEQSVELPIVQSIEPSEGECTSTFLAERHRCIVISSSDSETDQGLSHVSANPRLARSYRGLSFTPEYRGNEPTVNTYIQAGEKTKNASTLRKSTVDNSKATVAEDSSSEEHKTSDDETEANEELANVSTLRFRGPRKP